LESIEAFGLVERIDESLIMINENLGWPPRRLRYHFNATSEVADDPADAGFRASAEEFYGANSWDLKLYNFARILFENRLDDLSVKLGVSSPSANLCTKESIDALRAALRRAILGSPPSVPTLKPGRHPASTGFHGDGWDERVHWPPVGRWLKWAGRCENHTLHLPLEKQHQPLVVRFEAFYMANETIRDALMASIDGAEVDLKRMEIGYKDGVLCTAYEIIIPPSTASESAHWRTIDLYISRFALDTLSNNVSDFPQRPFALGDVDLIPLQNFSSRGSM
jgi:hypothetical protein